MRATASRVVVLAASMGCCATAARADDAAPRSTSPDADKPATQQIENARVVGHRDADTEARRLSTASKMVFGREELDRYGDTSIGEVLKRLPGITISGRPGRGGDIRMRGLGHGYTQVLINGEPAPRGFSLDSLAPEQVERIEIYRAPVAEHSARGIAGTINVVLREDYDKKQNEVRILDTIEQGHSQPGISVMRSDTVGQFGYNVTVNAFARNQGNEISTSTTAIDPASGRTLLDQQEFDDSRTIGEGLHFTSRLNWKFDSGDALNLQPFLMESRSSTAGNSTLAQPVGSSAAPYASASWLTESDSAMARLFGNWQHRMDRGAKLMVRFGYGVADSDNTTAQNDLDAAGNPSHVLFNGASIVDRSWSNGGKYSRPLGQGNEFAAGWDLESSRRTEGVTTVQDGVLQLAQFGGDIHASTTRAALYSQDEWRISRTWSSYAGLRWEGIETTSGYGDAGAVGGLGAAGGAVGPGGASIKNTSSVWSPLLHSLWKLSPDSPDQVRFSLTRSYRQPTLNNLVARPTLSTLYPADGPNSPTSPDKIGNPELKPELAWGLDGAFEHYLDQGGIVSASVFHRSIDDLMRASTTLQGVSWSPVPRWVTETSNVGHASASGIELEAKFRLAEVIAGAPPLDVRTNYSRFWSDVHDIVGPNNRLDQQPKQTANIGLDYRARAVPLTVGGNLNWTPAYLVHQSDTQIYYQGLKSVLDCYALWKFNPAVQLRLAIANLLHRDYITGNAVVSGSTDQTANVLARTYVAWTARLEIKL